MVLHTLINTLVKKLFGNNLVHRFSYVSLTITPSCWKKIVGAPLAALYITTLIKTRLQGKSSQILQCCNFCVTRSSVAVCTVDVVRTETATGPRRRTSVHTGTRPGYPDVIHTLCRLGPGDIHSRNGPFAWHTTPCVQGRSDGGVYWYLYPKINPNILFMG